MTCDLCTKLMEEGSRLWTDLALANDHLVVSRFKLSEANDKIVLLEQHLHDARQQIRKLTETNAQLFIAQDAPTGVMRLSKRALAVLRLWTKEWRTVLKKRVV